MKCNLVGQMDTHEEKKTTQEISLNFPSLSSL